MRCRYPLRRRRSRQHLRLRLHRQDRFLPRLQRHRPRPRELRSYLSSCRKMQRSRLHRRLRRSSLLKLRRSRSGFPRFPPRPQRRRSRHCQQSLLRFLRCLHYSGRRPRHLRPRHFPGRKRFQGYRIGPPFRQSLTRRHHPRCHSSLHRPIRRRFAPSRLSRMSTEQRSTEARRPASRPIAGAMRCQVRSAILYGGISLRPPKAKTRGHPLTAGSRPVGRATPNPKQATIDLRRPASSTCWAAGCNFFVGLML
jgi:hypothetical protein